MRAKGRAASSDDAARGDGCTSLNKTAAHYEYMHTRARIYMYVCIRRRLALATRCIAGTTTVLYLGRDTEIKPCTGAITIRQDPIGRRFVEQQRRSERVMSF